MVPLSTHTHSTRIAEPAMLWVDAYFEWISPKSECCGYNTKTHDKCKIGEGEECS